ncbi:MAG: hypothetical protein D6726_01660 [Nitrospirae bacterium]|nr:MAG: hypothetical protein D6726_01660 [Nitrospirota bacterium]
MAFGAWIGRFRFVLYAITFTLLGISFYRMYKGKGDVGRRTKIAVWTVATISITLTLYSILKNL